MNCSICRIEKIKGGGITGIQLHDRREKGRSNTNPDIDWSKTVENVDLLPRKEKFRTLVNTRISELNLKRKPRSDATLMCQCLLTSSSDFFNPMTKEEQVKYFEKSLEFIGERYGKENLISAIIHFDERTPHMHINFVPVTADGRLSARDIFTPGNLRKLQDDYHRFVNEQGYKLERGELNSKRKHLSVEEYKIETKYEELKEKKQELERLEEVDKAVDLKAEKGKLFYKTNEVTAIKVQNKSLKVDSYTNNRTIRELTSSLNDARNRVKFLEKELKGTEYKDRLIKQLKSEITTFNTYINSKPTLKKSMKDYFDTKKQAEQLAKDRTRVKEGIDLCLYKRSEVIEKTRSFSDIVTKYTGAMKDLTEIKNKYETCKKEISLKQQELDNTSFFKKKVKNSLQEDIDVLNKQIKSFEEHIEKSYGIDSLDKLDYCILKSAEHIAEAEENKKKCIEITNELERKRDSLVKLYKEGKILSECLPDSFSNYADSLDTVKLKDMRPLNCSLDDYKVYVDLFKKQKKPKQIIERLEKIIEIKSMPTPRRSRQEKTIENDWGMER